MKKKHSSWFFILLVALMIGSSSCVEVFPKIIWVFWSTGLDQAPSITKLCVNNIKYYADKSGWELRILTEKTKDKWLGDIARYNRIVA